MKSAYLILGISTQASTDEIRAAYQQKLKLLELQQKSGDELTWAARRTELNVAQDILLDFDKREAHNQALAETRRTPLPESQRITTVRALPPSAEPPSHLRQNVLILCLVLVIAIWANDLRLNREQAAAAQRIAAQQAQADAERAAQQADAEAQRQARLEQERTANLNDRQARSDMERSAVRAQVESTIRQYNDTQRMNAELAEARRVEAEARMAEQRRIAEGRRVADMDKRMVHELCMRNYGRYNC